MFVRKVFSVFGRMAVVSMILAACATPTPSAVKEQPVAMSAAAAPAIVPTEIPIAPAPTMASEATSKDPTTLINVWGAGSDPETLDPALNYESSGAHILQHVYESLITYEKSSPVDYIPQLATEWKIAADGKTYVFKIRQGVKFHGGETLTPQDVAYTFQRGLLQGGTQSPQWLLAQPLLGVETIDAAALVDPNLMDDPENLKNADPASLKAACEKVTAAVTADDAAGTVSFHLAQPWGPFLATLAGSWGSITSKSWIAANGGWDGSCDTWQNFYGITSDKDPFSTIVNGTGPFKLDHWTVGEEIVLARNDDYWRTEPPWPNGPSGPARLARIVINLAGEWGTRLAMLQAGDADFAFVPSSNYTQADELVGEECLYNPQAPTRYDCKTLSDKPLRVFKGIRGTARDDVFFNFNINIPEGGNPYVGSGKLDGNGVPSDFFSDTHIRKAFNYCFDWEIYIQEALRGEAVQATTIFMDDMPGFDLNAPHYAFDLTKCAQEFKAATLTSADGNLLWDTGFRLQAAFATDVPAYQAVAEILSENLAKVNPKFRLETASLPWPAFLDAQRSGTLPMLIVGWMEDIRDPHNWVVPYTTSSGAFAALQGLPKEATDEFDALATAGVLETDPAKRAAIYDQVNRKFYDIAPAILLANGIGRHYEQRWIQGWYDNPKYAGVHYYPIWKR